MMDIKNNMTAVRWFAAGLVLYGHSFVFLGIAEPTFLGWLPLGPLGVYIFFAISGYLISQSWDSDPDVFRFFLRRALRIFPGLAVCVVLTAFVFGPLLTERSLEEYFSSSHFYGYFSNIFLYIKYYLPGVFESNRVPNAVNGSLWSLPAEFSMYILVAVVGFIKAPRIVGVMVFLFLAVAAKFWALVSVEMLIVYLTDVRQVVICGVYFWAGVLIYRFSLARFFSVSNVVLVLVAWLCLLRWNELFVMASWVALPFLVLAFGLASSSALSVINKYDYSYGVYIYAFPVQQAVVYWYPDVGLGLYLVVVSLLTLILAAMSWHFVEKPALRLKPARREARKSRSVDGLLAENG